MGMNFGTQILTLLNNMHKEFQTPPTSGMRVVSAYVD